MDNFWAKLLILGIVAAIGVFFVANVYGPQKAAQQAMADSTQQSVNAVKAGVEDSGPSIVSSGQVIYTVEEYCKPGNTVTIVVNTGAASYSFTTDVKSPPTTGVSVNSIVDSSRKYVKVVEMSGTAINRITFTQQ